MPNKRSTRLRAELPRGRALVYGALFACSVLMSGCGLALTAGAVASKSSGSGTTPRGNTDPAIELTTFDDQAVSGLSPGAEFSGNLVIAATLVDGEGDVVDVELSRSLQGGAVGSFVTLPESAIAAGSLLGLETSGNGRIVRIAVNLDSVLNTPNSNAAQVVLRFSIRDRFGGSSTTTSPLFAIRNNDSPTLSLETIEDGSRSIPVGFLSSDSDALTSPGVSGFALSDGSPGTKLVSGFTSLGQSLTPGTLVITYGEGNYLTDRDQGDGTGRLVTLDGATFSDGSGAVDYGSGSFSGSASLVLSAKAPALSASFNRSFLLVTKAEFLISGSRKTCTPRLLSQRTPFPIDAARTALRSSYIWDAALDLDFGNSQFVTLEFAVSDGVNLTSASSNGFLVDNGPLGSLQQFPVSGDADNFEAGDLDRDGFRDVVVIGPRELKVFFGNGVSLLGEIRINLPLLKTPGGTPLLNTPTFGIRGAGELDLKFLTLIDVNQDGLLDVVAGHSPTSPEAPGGDAFNNFFVIFGTGTRQQPFDAAHIWGPLPSGGAQIRALRAASLNDDNNDGVIDEKDTKDLVIVSAYGHSPLITKSRSPLRKRNPVANEVLPNQGSGQPYLLAGVSLAQTPIFPGSVSLSFPITGGTQSVTDRPVLGSRLGLLEIAGNPGSGFAYIDYETGAIFADPRIANPALPAPEGPLSGTTPFTVVGVAAPLASYDQSLVPSLSDPISQLSFLNGQLGNGDSITLRGFGYKGLKSISSGSGVNAVAKVNIDLATLPVSSSLVVGTDVATIGDLLSALQIAFQSEVQKPATESFSVRMDASGFIVLELAKATPGPDTVLAPPPGFKTPLFVSVTDSLGSSWPEFEDPFGRVTIFHVIPVANQGGFFAPELSQVLLGSTGQPFFPASFPNQRIDLFPESPDLTGRPTAHGPGSFGAVQALVDQLPLGRQFQFPFALPTAASSQAALLSPASTPRPLKTNPFGTTPFVGGFAAKSLDVDKFIPRAGQGSDLLPDILVSCEGDGSLVALIKESKNSVLGRLGTVPEISFAFKYYSYIDGLYQSKHFDLLGTVNTTLLRSGDAEFIGDLVSPGNIGGIIGAGVDFQKDGQLDFILPYGDYLIRATSLYGAPPAAPALPYSLEIGEIGFGPSGPSVGDFNGNGRLDIALPLSDTKNVVILIGEPRGTEIIANGAGQAVDLTNIKLTVAELDRAVVFSPSLVLSFSSAGVAHEIRGMADNSLRLFRDPAGANLDMGSVGTIDPKTALLTGSTSVSVDGNLTATFDQLFVKNYIKNLSLLNLESLPFQSGFGPVDSRVFDLDADGLDDLVVLEGASNTIGIRRQLATLPFSRFSEVALGGAPLRIVKGDLISGNGAVEFVVSNSTDNTISILVPSAGSLKVVQVVDLSLPGFPRGLVPVDLVIADFEQDGGANDLVVSCISAEGQAGFAAAGQPSGYKAAFFVIPGLSKADFDAGTTFRPSAVGLSYGNSLRLSVLDLQGDGRPDLAVSNLSGGAAKGALGFYPNNGPQPGGLSALTNYVDGGGLRQPVALPIQGLSTAPNGFFLTPTIRPGEGRSLDLNRDGFPDFVVAVGGTEASASSVFTIFRGKAPIDNSDGISGGSAFVIDPSQPRVNNPLLGANIDIAKVSVEGCFDLITADFNADSRPDIVFSNPRDQAILGVAYNGTSVGGVFNDAAFSVRRLPSLGKPGGIAVGDLNSDGKVDFAVALESIPFVAIYFNRFDPNKASDFDPTNSNNRLGALFSSVQLLPTQEGPIAVEIADLNGDGKSDLIVVTSNNNTLNVFLQQ